MTVLTAVVTSMRPRQWVKNLFVLAGLVFSQRLFTESTWIALAAFGVFCAVSGAIYLLHAVAHPERARLDPKKRERPIAWGRLSVGVAIAAAVGLIAGGLVASALLARPLLITVLAYVALLVAYSAWLKHIVIVDVLVVAGGFVLRALA